MTRESQLQTYEHAGHLIYVHTYKAITDGWAVHVTVVGQGRDGRPHAQEIACDTELVRGTCREAVAAGEELARAFVDGLQAAA